MNFRVVSRTLCSAARAISSESRRTISSSSCFAFSQSLSKETSTGISFQMYWNPSL